VAGGFALQSLLFVIPMARETMHLTMPSIQTGIVVLIALGFILLSTGTLARLLPAPE